MVDHPAIGTELLDQGLTFTEKEFARGDYLFRRGSPVEHLFVLREGRCRLERNTYDGHTLKLAEFRPVQLIAEGSLFHPTYGCDCRALSQVTCSSVAVPAVLDLLGKQPNVARKWLTTLAQQVMELRTRLELRNVRAARDRLLLYLQLNADAQGSYRHGDSMKSLAEILGLSPESLYRTLAALEQERVLHRHNDMIQIIGPTP